MRELEACLGTALITTQSGGYGGGGSARLTPVGGELLRRYRRFRDMAAGAIEREFLAAFGPDAEALRAAMAAPPASPRPTTERTLPSDPGGAPLDPAWQGIGVHHQVAGFSRPSQS